MPTEADRRREDPSRPPAAVPAPLRRFQGSAFEAMLLCLAAAACASDPQAALIDPPRHLPDPGA